MKLFYVGKKIRSVNNEYLLSFKNLNQNVSRYTRVQSAIKYIITQNDSISTIMGYCMRLPCLYINSCTGSDRKRLFNSFGKKKSRSWFSFTKGIEQSFSV